ncbi:uncharacterized protein CDAR_185211 [Caerostris darwini]|uniref:Uncharacterized protein n=1 Tax=Caerostris darwini TaxID=1538125 RepID=A0AAV4SVU1_9ARAC|nr:uncharacterized protein CDAR_185211 [Caerostris darwini]
MEEIAGVGTSWRPFVRRPEWRQSFASGVSLPWLRDGERKGCGRSAKATTDAAASLSISLLGGWRERGAGRLLVGMGRGDEESVCVPLRCPSHKPPSSI